MPRQPQPGKYKQLCPKELLVRDLLRHTAKMSRTLRPPSFKRMRWLFANVVNKKFTSLNGNQSLSLDYREAAQMLMDLGWPRKSGPWASSGPWTLYLADTTRTETDEFVEMTSKAGYRLDALETFECADCTGEVAKGYRVGLNHNLGPRWSWMRKVCTDCGDFSGRYEGDGFLMCSKDGIQFKKRIDNGI